MHCSLCLFRISLLDSFLVVVLEGYFSSGRQKKRSLVALDRWLYYTVTIVREFAWVDSELVVLQRWSFDQVWLWRFTLIQNNFVCLMEKWVQIFKCIISHSFTKSLVPPLHKFTIQNVDLFFPLFWETKFA